MKGFRNRTAPSLPVIMLLLLTVFALTSGCAKRESGEIKIGATLVLTGPDARAGESARRGIEMSTELANERGGLNGRRIRVIYEDDQGEPQKAVAAVKKLINVDNVPVIIGPMWSSPTLAVAPIAEENKVVLLTPTASNPRITDAGDYIFRNTYSDAFEGSKTADYAYTILKYRRLGILYINNDFGVGLKEAFSLKLMELGGIVVITDSYDPSSFDFRSQLAKFKQSSIDAIYLVGYSEVGRILKQSKELGLNVPFISSIMFEITDVVETAGLAAEGVVYAYISYDPDTGDSLSISFSKAYVEKYGVRPDPEAAFSYDAMSIILHVISEVGTNSTDIKNRLYSVKDYHGVTGNTTFDTNGDVIKPIGFKRVINGDYVWEVFNY